MMVKLSDETVTLLDGDVRLTRRKNSSAWQAAFKIGDRWVRTTTKCKQLADAKERAKDLYMEYRFRAKNDLPIVSKRFDAVARLAVADMQTQLDAGTGRKVYRDYITAIDSYLIPFFGAKFVHNISHVELKEYAVWRATKMGREPKASTITTHNTALILTSKLGHYADRLRVAGEGQADLAARFAVLHQRCQLALEAHARRRWAAEERMNYGA